MNFVMARVREFWADRSGVAAIEFALVAPILLTLFLGSVVVALLFRDAKSVERATSVIADVVSRRTTVDDSYLAQCYTLLQNMTNRSPDELKFRISSLKKSNGALKVDWSYAPSWKAVATADLASRSFPLVSDGDSLLLVETSASPLPLVDFLSLPVGDYSNSIAERPRFTAAVSKTN